MFALLILLNFYDICFTLEPGMQQKLKYRINRRKCNPNGIEDLYDGRLYKELFDCDGFFKGSDELTREQEIHISLQLNTDGVALFKSSKFQVWPLYATINELPPEMR